MGESVLITAAVVGVVEGIRQGLAAAGIFRLVQAFTGDKTIVG